MKSQLAFFLHGTLCFFTEDLTFSMNKTAIHTWVKLMLMYRMNKVFSDQNIKEPGFRNTMIYYEHFRERAVFKNVTNVRRYFQEHLDELTELVRHVDNGIPEKTAWSYHRNLGEFVFRGIHMQVIYEVNLYTGIILKNGAELTGLPEVIKKNPTYVSIFGLNRDFEVYPETNNSLRTRYGFQEFFAN
jgi:hypothetical protein